MLPISVHRYCNLINDVILGVDIISLRPDIITVKGKLGHIQAYSNDAILDLHNTLVT